MSTGSINPYLKQQILNATPDELFLLFINKAIVLCKTEPIDTATILTIIDVLTLNLNREISNTFVDDIDALLSFLIFEIVKYNSSKDPVIMDGIITVLSNLQEAWKIRITTK